MSVVYDFISDFNLVISVLRFFLFLNVLRECIIKLYFLVIMLVLDVMRELFYLRKV